ncbi:sugar-transfer associated ATP-grasp domain-containing protein [Thauera sp. SDU_THAU2]|uniref:sugar-transfer associated ATP-grasp domain-containing protein n=1 Tax=Thauera sp. SDU_THAU2 TaxID=3136633 RepID=UPI00311E72B5
MKSYISVAAQKAKSGGLPLWRQLLEMGLLYVFSGLGPGYYLMARFWRPGLSMETKLKHWNGRKYLRFVHKINDPRYFKISQNKLVEKSFLSALGLPTARLLGLFHPQFGQDTSGQDLCTASDLARALALCDAGGLFFKPAEGDSGRGVFGLRLTMEAGRKVLREVLSGEEVGMDALALRLGSAPEGYVIEEMIEQHPVLARLNPTSVNTLRIWVVDDSTGIHVAGAFLRVGRAGSLVDNTAAGGLACAIDLNSGVISEALDLTLTRNQYKNHPDSVAELIGVQIPYWSECKQLACNALRVLPGARFVGMDLAVTTDGPMVVEYNVEPSYQGAAHVDKPHGVIFAGL